MTRIRLKDNPVSILSEMLGYSIVHNNGSRHNIYMVCAICRNNQVCGDEEYYGDFISYDFEDIIRHWEKTHPFELSVLRAKHGVIMND